MAVSNDFDIVRGDTWDEEWVFYLSDGTVADLTGAKLYLYVKASYDQTDAAAPIKLTSTPAAGIVIVDASLGRATMALTSVQTGGLVAGQSYYYDIQIVTAAAKVITLIRGRLTILPDVTTTTS